MQNIVNLGMDLGGTNIRAGLVNKNSAEKIISRRINAQGSVDEVLAELFSIADELIHKDVASIGIGVPGLINIEEGVVYDVVNIPSWKEVALKKHLQERYQIPVFVNNDANCFALGEYHFGKGKGSDSMIGLTIGTGLGSGIIIDKKLHAGKNGGAGEFGSIDYLEHNYEYYASGQFFKNVHQTEGETVFRRASEGDPEAIKMYEEMGFHLGNFIKLLLFSLDVELITLGGSVRHAWPLFGTAMWEQVGTFPFKNSLKHLKIELSEIENAAILGAASLYTDFKN